MASFPLLITQRFSVVRTITVEREGINCRQVVSRQVVESKPSFDDPTWQSDWLLVDEEIEPIDPPDGWDEVEGYDVDDEAERLYGRGSEEFDIRPVVLEMIRLGGYEDARECITDLFRGEIPPEVEDMLMSAKSAAVAGEDLPVH